MRDQWELVLNIHIRGMPANAHASSCLKGRSKTNCERFFIFLFFILYLFYFCCQVPCSFYDISGGRV